MSLYFFKFKEIDANSIKYVLNALILYELSFAENILKRGKYDLTNFKWMFLIKQIWFFFVIAGMFCHVFATSNYLMTINFFHALIIQIRLEWHLGKSILQIPDTGRSQYWSILEHFWCTSIARKCDIYIL